MIKRQTLFDMLKPLNYEVFSVGQNYRFSDVPYLVLRNAGQEASINYLGALNTWEVMVYVPDNSIAILDTILDRVEEALTVSTSEIKPNGVRGSDYHDTEINMYMNYIQFSVPKNIRGCY